MQALKTIGRWLGLSPGASQSLPVVTRGRVDHVVILDGTLSTLRDGCETNAGLTYKLLSEVSSSARLSLRYEAGVQWRQWRHTMDVIQGTGINRQIRRAYGFLASRYRPGDRIFLFGYSRGGYAVRSLAGVIDRVGLLRSDCATERNIRQAYRHYRLDKDGPAAQEFAQAYCHQNVEIEMVGVWDTVKALGLRLPIIWKLYETRHAFHNHHLGRTIRHGYQALAIDETREAFTPEIWECPTDWTGQMEQVWFRGAHGDVGGQIGTHHVSRPLSNVSLVWMLEKAAGCGLALPENWGASLPTDPEAPIVGTFKGWGKLFIARKARIVGADPSEFVHETAKDHKLAVKFNLPVNTQAASEKEKPAAAKLN